MSKFMSVIKWSGSKASQATQIAEYVNKSYNTYYEPFCGGCNMMIYLKANNYPIKHYVVSDINKDLIDTYNAIKVDSNGIQKAYTDMWCELNRDEDLERKKAYYKDIRDKFNRSRDPYLFYFIMRTAVNGMPRYNSLGDFNSSFHINRKGMHPVRVGKLLENWVELTKDVKFVHCSYEHLDPRHGDLVYLDPPYARTKGMYYGTIDYFALWKWINLLPCDYLFSFDGVDDYEYQKDIPISAEHHLLYSGKSSFRRIIGKSKHTEVYESLYVRLLK